MAFVNFWDQTDLLTQALKKWLASMHRSTDDIVKMDAHEFNGCVIDPEKDTVHITISFPTAQYDLTWIPCELMSKKSE